MISECAFSSPDKGVTTAKRIPFLYRRESAFVYLYQGLDLRQWFQENMENINKLIFLAQKNNLLLHHTASYFQMASKRLLAAVTVSCVKRKELSTDDLK